LTARKNRSPGGPWKVCPNPAAPIQTWPSFLFFSCVSVFALQVLN
jgi:hypothetical protein